MTDSAPRKVWTFEDGFAFKGASVLKADAALAKMFRLFRNVLAKGIDVSWPAHSAFDGEDIANEAFVRAFKYRESFLLEENEPLKWLYGIAEKVRFDFLRDNAPWRIYFNPREYQVFRRLSFAEVQVIKSYAFYGRRDPKLQEVVDALGESDRRVIEKLFTRADRLRLEAQQPTVSKRSALVASELRKFNDQLSEEERQSAENAILNGEVANVVYWTVAKGPHWRREVLTLIDIARPVWLKYPLEKLGCVERVLVCARELNEEPHNWAYALADQLVSILARVSSGREHYVLGSIAHAAVTALDIHNHFAGEADRIKEVRRVSRLLSTRWNRLNKGQRP